jgi:predicted sulfurtransferase
MDTESSSHYHLSHPQNSTKSYPCHCPPDSVPGTVLLFYRYFANNPVLPVEHAAKTQSPEDLAAFHRDIATSLALTGKLRIAKEGFNITIAGSASHINEYVDACCRHWSFSGLSLTTEEDRRAFFKPTPGCPCVFCDLGVKVCEEITPMGVTGYSPRDWGSVREVQPGEWHALLTTENREEAVLLDVRNHYESALGYFASSSGSPAIRPQVRRFGQFPQYIKRRRLDGQIQIDKHKPKRIFSYCTGGIRCEKATRFMTENLPRGDTEVLTLKGGIAAYLSWIDNEIRAGRLTPNDSLFKGRNYVFDGRGSVGLEGGGEEVVGVCHGCSSLADGTKKCSSAGCHLELVICPDCAQGEVLCCQDCGRLGEEIHSGRIDKRPMCACERTREMRLWGDEAAKIPKKQAWKKWKQQELIAKGRKEQVSIQVQIIQA